jgi:hypothetical protein
MAGARYAYPGAVLSLLSSDLTFDYYDYQLRADHPLGPGKLHLLVLGSYDRLENVTKTSLGFERVDLGWRGGVGGGTWNSSMVLGHDRAEAYFQGIQFQSRSLHLGPRLSWSRRLGEHVEMELGADGELQFQKPKTDSQNPELAGFTRSRTVTLGGAYTSAAVRLGRRLVLVPGLRVDAYREGKVERVDLAPRLAATLDLTDQLRLKLSGGRFSQMPNLPLQLPGVDGFDLGQYGLQTAWHGSTGVEARFAGGFTAEATAFVHRYVLTDVRDPDLGDPLLNDFLVRRDALSYGLELMLRRPASERLSGWLSYTLSSNLRALEGGVITDADWDQRHVLNLVTNYRWGRYTFGGRLHLRTGRPVEVDHARPARFMRLPPYFQLDLRLERRSLFDSFSISYYLEVVNATLSRQVTDLRQEGPNVERTGYTVVLPSLGMRAEF